MPEYAALLFFAIHSLQRAEAAVNRETRNALREFIFRVSIDKLNLQMLLSQQINSNSGNIQNHAKHQHSSPYDSLLKEANFYDNSFIAQRLRCAAKAAGS